MALQRSLIFTSLLGWIPTVLSHGNLLGMKVNGGETYNYHPLTFKWPPLYNENYVSYDKLQHPDIICGLDSTPAPESVEVPAGAKLDLQWKWPSDYSHPGCIMTYIAPCNGPCKDVDMTKLEFIKIQAGCMIGKADPPTPRGKSGDPNRWVTDDLIETNWPGATVKERYLYSVTLPKELADDEWVLRSELIAAHFDEKQFYPNCATIKITGGGTAKPKGTIGTQLYDLSLPRDFGLTKQMNVWGGIDSFPIPGPPRYNGNDELVQTINTTAAEFAEVAAVIDTPTSSSSTGNPTSPASSSPSEPNAPKTTPSPQPTESSTKTTKSGSTTPPYPASNSTVTVNPGSTGLSRPVNSTTADFSQFGTTLTTLPVAVPTADSESAEEEEGEETDGTPQPSQVGKKCSKHYRERRDARARRMRREASVSR